MYLVDAFPITISRYSNYIQLCMRRVCGNFVCAILAFTMMIVYLCLSLWSKSKVYVVYQRDIRSCFFFLFDQSWVFDSQKVFLT